MGKAFEIEYKHKKVEIHIIDFVGNVRDINGTPDLFSLSYNSNINDKGQYILATEAEINIYEDAYFNIDELKTVGETDILIKYFEYDELVWQGFALPDFFQTGITKPKVLRIVATDRLGVLKDIVNTSVGTTPKEIIEECLLQTGLSLPVEIRNNNTYLETTTINRERIEGLSAYDIIRSFMVQFNSKIVQYKNRWWVVNKKLLEDGFFNQEIIDIDLVYLDGQREIKPTASEVSLYLEFGGSKKYPKNWNFRETDFNTIFKDWSVQPTDKASTAKITGYNVVGTVQTPIYGDSVNVPSLEYVSGKLSPLDWEANPLMLPAKKSSFTTFSLLPNINYTLDFRVNFTSASNIHLLAFILLKKGNEYFVFSRGVSRDIILESAGTGTPTLKPLSGPITIEPDKREAFGAVQTQWNIELGLDRKMIGLSEDETDTVEVQIIILKDRIYTSPITETTIIIHSAELALIDREVAGKGLIFKTKQGGDKFSKVRETETTLFSDKINQGVNGYFYNYKYDDTSITNLPKEYLLEMTQQMADMFSSARDFYSIGGKFKVNPLARYRCGDKYFVFVGGVSHREISEIDIEEIVSNDTLIRTDYIYTYFEDSKDNIKSIGTASGSGGSGGTGGGGGMTSSQLEILTNLADWWKLDEENDAIYSLKSVYSLKGVSALGLGPDGGGGGGGGDVEISITGSGNAVTGVSKSGNTLTFAKSSTFALSTHNHTIAQITGLQSVLNAKQNTLIAGTNITISGNTISASGGMSSVSWGDITGKPTTLAGYGITALDVKNTAGLNSDTLALGLNSQAIGSGSVALGKDSQAYGSNSLSIRGYLEGNDSIVVRGLVEGINSIGVGGTVYGDDSVAIGGYVEADNSVAIGKYSSCEEPNTGVLGTNGANGNGANKWIIPGNLAIGKNSSATSALDVNGVIKATGGNSTNWNDAFSERHTHDNKSVIDELTQGHINVLNLLSVVDGNIKVDATLWATGGISALGLGEGGSSGGGVDMLDSWANYTAVKANYYAPASLLVPFRNDTLSRLASLEAGGGAIDIEVAVTGAGNAITGVSKSGNTLTFAKGSTFSLSTHNHDAIYKPIGYVPSWGEITEKPTTFAPSAHTHTIANVTGLQDALDGKEPSFTKNTAFNKNFGITDGTVMQGNDSRVHSHANKPILDQITQSNIDVLAKLSIVDGNIKVDTTLWATGGISALGLGSGGGSGGGGADMLDSWANYTTTKANYYVPASLLVNFRSTTITDINNLKSGSATSIVTNGNGNAITSLTKSGSVITATKGLTFALSSHTHTIAQITGLQGALNLKATQSDIDTAIDGIEIGGRNLVLNSKGDSLDVFTSKSSVSIEELDGFECVRIKNIGSYFNGAYTVTDRSTPYMSVLPDTEYTVSFWYQMKGTESAHSRVYTYPVTAYVETLITNSNTSKWEYFSFTFRTHSSVTRLPLMFRIAGTEIKADAYLYIRNVKLEKGTIATDWTPAPEDVQAEIDGIEIGGRNLLLNTTTEYNEKTIGTYGVVISDSFSIDNLGLKEGDNVVVSVDLDNVPENKRLRLQFNWFRPTEVNDNGITSGVVGNRYWMTSTVPQGAVTGRVKVRGDAGVVFSYKNIKLEKGNKATDWTPAPEDQVSDWSTTDVTSFSYIKNKPTTLAGYGITDAITTNTTQTITGAKTFNANITLGINKYIAGTDNYTGVWNVDNLLWRFGSSKAGSVANIRSEKVGIGTDSPLYKLDVRGTGRFTGNVTAPTFIGALTGNASSATKLQTARTIAGISFDGSDNIAIPFANLASKPTTLAGYGITDGALNTLNLTAGNGLTGGGTLEANRAFALGLPSTLTNATTNAVTATSHTHAITTTTVGASNTIVATDASGAVRGNIIRIGGNWTLELSGSQLVFKYNGVTKQRMLSDGTILATSGITALSTE